MMQTSPSEQMPMQSEETAVENQESTESDDKPDEVVQQEEIESDGEKVVMKFQIQLKKSRTPILKKKCHKRLQMKHRL